MTPPIDQPDLRALAGHAEGTIVTLVVAALVWRMSMALIDRFFARRFVSRFMPRVATFCSLVKSIVGLLIVVAGTLELLNIWAVDVAPAVWSAGFITAALAFGSQNLVRDVVTGFFFLFEDQYDVGDRIELVTTGGQVVAGTVDGIELRTTRIVDRQGRYVVVPNGNVAFITNASRLPGVAVVTLTLPWKADATAMRERITGYARDVVAAAGKRDARLGVVLVDSTVEGATFRIELRSPDADADLERLHLREGVIAKLQGDGWLPGHEETH